MKNPSRIREVLDIRGDKISQGATVQLLNLWDLLAEVNVGYREFVNEVMIDLLRRRRPPFKADLSCLSSAHVSRAVTSIALSFPELVGDIFMVFEREVKLLGPGTQRGSDNAIAGTMSALIGLESENFFASEFEQNRASRHAFEKRVLELLEKGIREGWFTQVGIDRDISGQLSNSLGCFIRNGQTLFENPMRDVYRANHLIGLTHTFYRLNERKLLPLEKLNTLSRVIVDEVCMKVFAHAPRWARLEMLHRGLPTHNPQS